MPEQATHPSPETLNAFGLGQLPLAEATVVESHISECEPCCATLLGASSDDTFVELLQKAKQLPVAECGEPGSASAGLRQSNEGIPKQLAEHPRYEIVGLIGKGGMGDVYKASHRMMERTVALKIINRELMRKPEAVDRFHREVKAAAQLSHPNIVTAYDAERAGDVHFLAMEFVDGVDLSQTVKHRGALPVGDACHYVQQAATGLQSAYERGMVHRDIKPHNLMVTADGTVKILDFGLAALAPEAAPDSGPVATRGDLTAAGSIMGTPDFISPEQAQDAREADIRSDIYSLGATLYFLLSARPPFADGSVMNKLKNHAQAEPAPLGSIRDDIPAGLSNVLSKMMAKDPADRFQTPAELAEALQPFSDTPLNLEQQSPQLQQRPRRFRNRVLPLTAIATLLVAAIVTAFAFLFSPADGPYMIGGGGAVANDEWQFSSGCLYLQRNEPGVLLGMYEDPAGNRDLSYVVLFRHNVTDTTSVSRPLKSGLRFDGLAASMATGILIDGKGVELGLDIQLDEQQREITSTKMTINGNDVDYAAGRLFLVDLTAETVTWTQVNAKFPNSLPNPQELSQNTDAVSNLAQQLTRYDRVREFLAASPPAPGGGSSAAGHGDAASDHQKIQGTWQVTYSEDNGRIAPQEMLQDLRFVFAQDSMTTEVMGRQSTSTYTLDPSTTPKAIDMTENGRTTLGIYDLQGDTLRLCFAEFRQERPTAFDSQPESVNDVVIILKRIRLDQKMTADEIISRLNARHGNLVQKLHEMLSEAAGIPNAQWQEFASDPSGSPDAIKGEPLSLVLWQLNPLEASTKDLMVLRDFQYLGGVPKPAQLSDAMFPSHVDGYYSMIQPHYISGLTFDLKQGTHKLKGDFHFQAPNLYAGKIDYAVQITGDELKVVQFTLSNYGITIVRRDDGLWKRSADTAQADVHSTIQGTPNISSQRPEGKDHSADETGADTPDPDAAPAEPRKTDIEGPYRKEFPIELADDQQAASLSVEMHRGSIMVMGQDRDDVLVRLTVPDFTSSSQHSNDRIVEIRPNNPDFDISNASNVIKVDSNSREYTTNLEILVPHQVNLRLDSYRDGTIEVSNVVGHLEVRSHNNDISLSSVAGSARVWSYNGSIVAGFDSVWKDRQLYFESYNGSIHIHLPADLEANTSCRTGSGRIFTNFEVQIEPPEVGDNTEHDAIQFNQFVTGTINGGGPELHMETEKGDIRILRRMKAGLLRKSGNPGDQERGQEVSDFP